MKEVIMRIGEVCFLTNDVRRLAGFYKRLLEVENNSDDETHQFILTEETSLTVYNDGTVKNNQNQNICLAFPWRTWKKHTKRCWPWERKSLSRPQKDPGARST